MTRRERGLRVASTACILSCVMLCPAHADVFEIADDGSIFVRSGAGAAQYASPSDGTDAPPGAVPSEAITAMRGVALPKPYADAIHRAAERYDVSAVLLEAMVWQESRWHARAVSPVGAVGLMQLMPDTARELGVDPRDPLANIDGGARYLRQQLDRFDGDVERALAAYNAGAARVIRAGGIPRITETRNYVTAILSRLTPAIEGY